MVVSGFFVGFFGAFVLVGLPDFGAPPDLLGPPPPPPKGEFPSLDCPGLSDGEELGV